MSVYRLGNNVVRKTYFVVQYRNTKLGVWCEYEKCDIEEDAMKTLGEKWSSGLEVRVVKIVEESSVLAARSA